MFASTAFIFSFTFFGVKAYQNFVEEDDIFIENTDVAGFDLQGKTKQQAESLLQTAVSDWKKNTVFTFRYKERSYVVDNGIFQFNIPETLIRITGGNSNDLQAHVNKESLKDQLKNVSLSIEPDAFKLEDLQNQLASSAGHLEKGSHSYQLERFLIDKNSGGTILSKGTATATGINKELTSFVKAVPTIELKGNSTFSFGQFLMKSGTNAFTDQTLSQVASAIYEAILPTNFTILERNIGASLPSYAKLGYEAKVTADAKVDLVFANTNASEYTIAFTYRNGAFDAVLKGSPFLYRYKVEQKGSQSFEPKTIVQFDTSFPPGMVQLKTAGQKGQRIKMYRIIYDESGSQLKREMIADDFYAPVHRIEIHGLTVPVIEKDISNETDGISEENTGKEEKKAEKSEDGEHPDNGGVKEEKQPEGNEDADSEQNKESSEND
ncbi:VanW family protein [Bacillus sp. 1P06AnD]|uniref:VanW family protein n=1 Tax=Bacillus sp. 1P06AnD TaxID=3132208 RepID=UPI0039A12ACF